MSYAAPVYSHESYDIVPGERITILEQQAIAGGALDGLDVPEKGFVIRGGREMEDHFECL